MHFINKLVLILVFGMFMACSKTTDQVDTSLKTYVNNEKFETGAVIACAASDNNGDILTFFYPKIGAKNAKYFETINTDVDNTDFSNYAQVLIPNEDLFNGYLSKFTQKTSIEKWIIITFELNNEIKISNPIRSKQIAKPTIWSDDVIIDQSEAGMPNFTWADNLYGENAIYFQIISDNENNLLSGTYTYENQFQFYKTTNVVLNITNKNPPELVLGRLYSFTLMDVSIDNWVNGVITKTFDSE